VVVPGNRVATPGRQRHHPRLLIRLVEYGPVWMQQCEGLQHESLLGEVMQAGYSLFYAVTHTRVRGSTTQRPLGLGSGCTRIKCV